MPLRGSGPPPRHSRHRPYWRGRPRNRLGEGADELQRLDARRVDRLLEAHQRDACAGTLALLEAHEDLEEVGAPVMIHTF